MKNEKKKHVIWAREIRGVFTRNWREKILAVVIAFFFWHMVKQQTRPLRSSQDEFLELHSLGKAAGIEQRTGP